MYYLIEIQGEMVSGKLISKQPPTQASLNNLQNVGKKNKGEKVTITPIEWGEIVRGSGVHPNDFTEGQLIRKYLDNHKSSA